MYISMDEKSMMSLDEILTEFKQIFDSIMEKFSNISLKKQYSVDALVNRYSEDKKFLKKLDNINDLMKEISDKLEALHDFENEFHNFLSIQNMVGYIIKDIEKYFKYSSFVNELTSSFCELIHTKIMLLKSNEYEKYNEIYKSFDDVLFKNEEFFYLNIYQHSHQYDDLIDEITNILW